MRDGAEEVGDHAVVCDLRALEEEGSDEGVDHFAKWSRAGILELCRKLQRRLSVSASLRSYETHALKEAVGGTYRPAAPP
jgi:hypothetical protein